MTNLSKAKETTGNDRKVAATALSDSDFHALMTATIPHLRAFGRSLCGCRDRADDLTQETLLKAWAARERFEAGTNFRAWTFTILRNVYFGQFRRDRFYGDYDEAEAERILNTTGDQESHLEAVDVLRAMKMLRPAQRELLILVAVGNVSYEEMAEICGVAIGTIKSRIARGRAALSAIIENGILPDARHDFVLKGEVLDEFLSELRDMSSNSLIASFAA